jgi:DNA repair protein RadC
VGGARRSGNRIQDWPESERPRERLLRLGVSALSDAELLGLLLRHGRGGRSAVDLGREVLALGGQDGLGGLGRATAEELGAVPGIGVAKAAAVLAGLELGRRAALGAPVRPSRLRGPEDAAGLLMSQLGGQDRERFVVLLLDSKHGLLATETVAVGGLDHVPADPREVFKPAIRRSAAAVIVAHNHPSGDPEPSRQDLALTERLVGAGRLLGVPVLDHIIIGCGRYVSLAATGLVAFER